jgi:hypothetical protein
MPWNDQMNHCHCHTVTVTHKDSQLPATGCPMEFHRICVACALELLLASVDRLEATLRSNSLITECCVIVIIHTIACKFSSLVTTPSKITHLELKRICGGVARSCVLLVRDRGVACVGGSA